MSLAFLKLTSKSSHAQPSGGCITHLDEGTHVGKVGVHGTPIGEVLAHPLHEVAKAAVGQLVCEEMRMRPPRHQNRLANTPTPSRPCHFSHLVTLNPVSLGEAPHPITYRHRG